MAINQDPGSWDPIDTFVTFWGSVGSNLYDGLTMRGADLKLQPGLATKWEYLDDNKRLRFTLRQGVKFHNGEPFNADAVKFTFDRLLGAEGAKGPQKSNYDSIGEVKVVDENTVDFILKQPDPVLLTKLAGYGAMIVPPKYIQEKGEDNFNTHPVGTGPFKFESYQPKVNVTLARNDEYWGGKPKLDKLVYRFIGEPGTQVAELQAGRVDIATLIPLGLIETVKKSGNADVISTGGRWLRPALQHQDRHHQQPRRAPRADHGRGPRRHRQAAAAGPGQDHRQLPGTAVVRLQPRAEAPALQPAEAKKLLAAAGVKPGATVQIDVRGSDSNFREVAQAVSATCRPWACAPPSSRMRPACCSTTSSPAARPAKCGRTSGAAGPMTTTTRPT